LKKEEFYDKLMKIVKEFGEYKHFDVTPREFKIKKEKLLKILKKFK